MDDRPQGGDDRLQRRLEVLKQEFAVGQVHLQEMTNQQTTLRETMLRISGAIQVLEELLNDGQAAPGHATSVEDPLLVASQDRASSRT